MLLLPISFVSNPSCQLLFTAHLWPIACLFFCLFMQQHALSHLNAIIDSAEHDDSWPLLLECITRFYMWKLFFHWRLVPSGPLAALPSGWFSPSFAKLLWRPARTVRSSHLFLSPALELWRKLAYFFILLSHSFCTTLNLLYAADSQWKQRGAKPSGLTTDHHQVSPQSGNS